MKKKVLSLVLVLCMMLSLLPVTAQAVATSDINVKEWVKLIDAFGGAKAGTTTTIKVFADFASDPEYADSTGFYQPLTVPAGATVILDLQSYSITYNGTSTGSFTENMFDIQEGGSLTIRGVELSGVTGANGGITLTGNNSRLVTMTINSVLNIESRETLKGFGPALKNTATTNGGLIDNRYGTVTINKGVTLSAKSFFPIFSYGGTVETCGNISGNYGGIYAANGAKVKVTGGTISTENAFPLYISDKASLNMTGGTVSSNTVSGVALAEGCAASTISGGKVTTASATQNAVFAQSPLTISGTAEISASNFITVQSESTLNIAGGTITATDASRPAVLCGGNTTVSGGTISGKNIALYFYASAAATCNISGGAITSDTSTALYMGGYGNVNISGGSLTSNASLCAAYNAGAGTLNISGGTYAAQNNLSVLNADAGTVKVASGTLNAIADNGKGKVVIDGGSVNIVQGATPKNSAGTALRCYPVTLTGNVSTALADDSFTFTFDPAVTYNFKGLKTDANSSLYHLRPIQEAIDKFNDRQFTRMDEELTRQRAADKLAKLAPVSPCVPLCEASAQAVG